MDRITEHPTSTAAPPEQESAQLLPYKYHYKVFDGFTGERYLLSLAQKFAPFALWRTWQAAVSYQAPGEECYVGVARLIDERAGGTGIHVGVGERKVYLDFEALEARGWLVLAHMQKSFRTKDGTIVLRVVPTKDFTGFYDTAYDYHQWLSDPGYIAPERCNVPLILADPALVKRLIRFENYRRLLVNAKPGRKPQRSQQDFYRCQLSKLAEQRAEEEAKKVNLYSNTLTKEDSLYRIPGSDQSTNREGYSEDSTAGEKGHIAAKTIRKFHPKSYDTNSPPNPNPEPPEEEQGGASAKEVQETLGYTAVELKQDRAKRGAAMAGIPADQYAKLNGGLDQTEQQEEAAQRQAEVQEVPAATPRPAREIPTQVEKAIIEFAQQYDDTHLVRSDVTRVAKIYFTAAQTLEHFNDTLFFALFDQAHTAALKKHCERSNSHGRVNRVPFFFTCLENAFSFSLEELVYLRSDDALYSDYSLWDVIDTVRDNYHRLFNTGQITDDYRTWLCDILDDLEKRTAPKQRLNLTTRD